MLLRQESTAHFELQSNMPNIYCAALMYEGMCHPLNLCDSFSLFFFFQKNESLWYSFLVLTLRDHKSFLYIYSKHLKDASFIIKAPIVLFSQILLLL